MWVSRPRRLRLFGFSCPLASPRELIAEAGAAGAVTGDSERVLRSRSCVSFLSEWWCFWLGFSAKRRLRHGAFLCRRYPSNE